MRRNDGGKEYGNRSKIDNRLMGIIIEVGVCGTRTATLCIFIPAIMFHHRIYTDSSRHRLFSSALSTSRLGPGLVQLLFLHNSIGRRSISFYNDILSDQSKVN